jgi:hypothetical protein
MTTFKKYQIWFCQAIPFQDQQDLTSEFANASLREIHTPQ